jgi:RNA polymerase sigma factor (sigma-70 family)
VKPVDAERLIRELGPQVLGSLTRRYCDFAAAEDAVQEALLAAARQWPAEGIPENPKAWLTHVASRRMVDEIRGEVARRKREMDAAWSSGHSIAAMPETSGLDDDTLVLMYMCCHPALTTSSSIALTLRAVGGLTTAEIARAFLVPEPTIAQRISRAKQTIKDSGIPFRLPEPSDLTERHEAVLHVLYLIFNEGYTASHGNELQRRDLASEAIRLARVVHERLPEDAETAGLLALMLFTDARCRARTGPLGEAIPIDEQDRSLWDRNLIDEGVSVLSRALSKGRVGLYQLQAAIAAVHDEAPSPEETDWPQILALYDLLLKTSGSPVIRLNRAVAVAMVHGPREALRLLADLETDDRLGDHYRLHAVRGHLLEMVGDELAAAASYRAAVCRTASTPERNYLLSKIARLTTVSPV